MESSTKPLRGFKALVILALLSVYVAGYGVLRWRKVLVCHKFTTSLKAGETVTEIRAGHDFRTSGVGAFKNLVAAPLATFYWPLRWVEAAVRTLPR